MTRRRRIDLDGGIHHVMNRGVNRQAIFYGEVDRIEFGRRLGDVHQRFGVETLAYCLMDNHYHLLLRTPNGGLSEAMHRLGSLYSRHTNDRVGRDGPLFRSRFHSIHVTTDAYLLMATRYIHRNALDIARVQSLDGYRWSSYQAYTGQRRVPSFMRTDIVGGLFGDDVAAFEAFHRSDNSSQILRTSPRSVAELRQMADFVLAHDDLHHGDDNPPPPWRDRTLLVLLLTHCADAPWHDELARDLAFTSPDARRMAISRARHRREVDPAIARTIAALVQLVSPQRQAA